LIKAANLLKKLTIFSFLSILSFYTIKVINEELKAFSLTKSLYIKANFGLTLV